TDFEACSAFTARCSLLARGVTYVTLCIRGFSRFVTSTTAPIATGWSESCRVGLSPTGGSRLSTAHFEACLASTHVAACTLARSPIRYPLSEGFSHFVASMTAPVASGWSDSPGGPCTHWRVPPFHGAHPKRSSPGFNRNHETYRIREALPEKSGSC